MRKHNPRQLRIWIPDPRSIDDMATIRGKQSIMTPKVLRTLCYLVLLAVLTLGTVLYALTWFRDTAWKESGFGKASQIWTNPSSDANNTAVLSAENTEVPVGVHPIEHLMNVATKKFGKLKNNEINTLEQAAAQYRKLRGHHPPPRFDTWYTYATLHKAIINERFWDQIYADLAPFWSLDPVTLRRQAHVFSPKISIRNGKVEAKTHNQHSKLGIWEDMLTTLANEANVHLPDLDVPLNVNDEPAMLVPWEAIDTALSRSRKIMLEPSDVLIDFSGLKDIENMTTNYDWNPEWLGPRLTHPSSHLGPRPLWSLVKPACPPRSPTRQEHVYNDIWDPEGGVKESHTATALLPSELPTDSLKGYIKNWTTSADACQQPYLQGLHSAFVSPKEMGVATTLFPLFGDAKLAMSNEILLPSTAEWNASSSFLSVDAPWHEKQNKLHWRGKSIPARDPARFWRRFERERLVAMMNATHVEIAEAAIHTGNESTVGVGYARNFRLLPANEYHLKSQTGGELAEWVNSWADGGFTEVECAGEEGGCGEFFSSATPPDPENKEVFKFGIALDSANFIGHLHAAKVTLRTSIYRTWHDARLIPWLHFIPIDTTLVDLYGVMEYFLGSVVRADAPGFPHAIGEVQVHEHHFKTPENAVGNGEATSAQSGNEPHVEHARGLRRNAGNDDAAHRIAEAGKEWADKVLRREDMLVYVYRLLLEYARLVDDKRDRIGWVGDLM
jgi:hypothetical protein